MIVDATWAPEKLSLKMQLHLLLVPLEYIVPDAPFNEYGI